MFFFGLFIFGLFIPMMDGGGGFMTFLLPLPTPQQGGGRKLRRKFNNLRRKLKNYSALSGKLLRTRRQITPHSQANYCALSGKYLRMCCKDVVVWG